MSSETATSQTIPAHRYLLIAGAPKSATTSLFRYLSDHADICSANRKEIYFFARAFDDKNVCQVEETLDSFETYFAHCANVDKLRIEATPYTLYTPNAAQKIGELLPDSSVLVLLRDPVDRFVSDFRFRKQRHLPEVEGKTLGQYANFLIHRQSDECDPLKVGCYIEFLRPFYERLGEEKILVFFYEEFRANLVREMKKLCTMVGIDPDYYTDYQFERHNQTINVRYEWLNHIRMNLEPRVAELREIALRNRTVHRLFEKMIDLGRYNSPYQSSRSHRKRADRPRSAHDANKLLPTFHPRPCCNIKSPFAVEILCGKS